MSDEPGWADTLMEIYDRRFAALTSDEEAEPPIPPPRKKRARRKAEEAEKLKEASKTPKPAPRKVSSPAITSN